MNSDWDLYAVLAAKGFLILCLALSGLAMVEEFLL